MIGLPTAQIVIDGAAPGVEHFAARELQRYLFMLFGKTFDVTDHPSDGGTALVLIGNPTTNPAIAAQLTIAPWPVTSDQTIVLKSRRTDDSWIWILGGGSPSATLWAVYEFVERFGVRYLLSGDIFPEPLGTFGLPEVDEAHEPVFRDRIWRLMNDEPHGPEMWSLDEYRRVIDQLAKQKVNAIYLSTYPSHPFVDYTFHGLRKSTATLNYGLKYPIDDDVIGREHFGDAAEFMNPEFRHCRTYDDWISAGQRFAHAVFAHAKSRGMRVGMAFSLTDVPQEFKERFHEWAPPSDVPRDEPGKTDFSRLGVVTIGTPPRNRGFQNVTNPVLQELSELLVKTHVETYPEIDFIITYSAEFRNPVAGYEQCWKHLDEKYGIEAIAPLDQLVQSARSRFYHGEGRAERELKADIEFLYFVDKIFVERRVLDYLSRSDIQVIVGDVTYELHPILGRILPRSFSTHSIVDYNLSLALPQIDSLASFETSDVDHHFTISLQDDSQSLLVSSEGARIERFLDALKRHRFTGWTTRFWSIGDLDHSAHYLSRASWQAGLTASEAYDDYIRMLGGEAALPEMREALRLLEENSAVQDVDLFAVGFPYPNLMRGHFEMRRHFEKNSAPHEQLLRCRDTYVRVRGLLSEARGKTRRDAWGRLTYLIGRCATCALFLETAYTVERAGFASRAAQQAREDRDPDALNRHLTDTATLLQRSLGLARQTARSQADNVRDESDVGLLAAMNEYMVKYLKAMSFLASHQASSWHL